LLFFFFLWRATFLFPHPVAASFLPEGEYVPPRTCFFQFFVSFFSPLPLALAPTFAFFSPLPANEVISLMLFSPFGTAEPLFVLVLYATQGFFFPTFAFRPLLCFCLPFPFPPLPYARSLSSVYVSFAGLGSSTLILPSFCFLVLEGKCFPSFLPPLRFQSEGPLALFHLWSSLSFFPAILLLAAFGVRSPSRAFPVLFPPRVDPP